jgi:hypothetical protein
MFKLRNLVALAAPVAVALVAWSCDRAATPVSPRVGPPNFWAGSELCPGGKFTGGGRIDPPDHQDAEDQEDPQSGPQMSGKVTFGFNVFLGSDANGNCVVQKGEIQVVHHQPEFPFQITWHIAIHNGANDIDGSAVPARTYISSRGGLCVVVGPTAVRTHAVTLQQEGTEQGRMTACDNGEPGSSPGFGPDAFRWESEHFGDTQLQFLTGGNIQAH